MLLKNKEDTKEFIFGNGTYEKGESYKEEESSPEKNSSDNTNKQKEENKEDKKIQEFALKKQFQTKTNIDEKNEVKHKFVRQNTMGIQKVNEIRKNLGVEEKEDMSITSSSENSENIFNNKFTKKPSQKIADDDLEEIEKEERDIIKKNVNLVQLVMDYLLRQFIIGK